MNYLTELFIKQEVTLIWDAERPCTE